VTNTRIAIASTIAVLFALPASAQSRSAYTTPVDTTVTIERGGTLSVSVYSGRVNVTGGSGSQVQIRGTTERTDLEVRARPTSVTIGTDPEGPHRGRVELDIVVPIGTRVVLDGFSAPFSIKGVKGEVKIESLSGSAVVNDAVGKVNVETVSGNIDIDRVDGDVTAEAVSGRVGITNVKGDIDTETVSGRIGMTSVQSNTVRAESVSGSLSYDGTFDETGSYTFKTHSGRLTLGIPANAGANVSLETFSGTVDSDFPVTMLSSRNRGDEGDNRFEFKVGNGKARVVAETFSGSIRIMRGTTSQSRDQ
jgi:hypothetical protein